VIKKISLVLWVRGSRARPFGGFKPTKDYCQLDSLNRGLAPKSITKANCSALSDHPRFKFMGPVDFNLKELEFVQTTIISGWRPI
jgi:hypothetical protein